jgi:hypothetical protein
LVDASISEKHTLSTFRVEVVMLENGGFYIGLQEGEAEGVGQSVMRNWRGGQKFWADRESPSTHRRGRGLGRELGRNKLEP